MNVLFSEADVTSDLARDKSLLFYERGVYDITVWPSSLKDMIAGVDLFSIKDFLNVESVNCHFSTLLCKVMDSSSVNMIACEGMIAASSREFRSTASRLYEQFCNSDELLYTVKVAQSKLMPFGLSMILKFLRGKVLTKTMMKEASRPQTT